MKSTGITRRIDDLGRVVIPKEIRRNLKIKENEILEIFIDNENIILKKFSSFDDMNQIFKRCVNVLEDITLKNILITNRDKIVMCNESKKSNYINKDIGPSILEVIDKKDDILGNDKIELLFSEEISTNYFISPIINNGDILGTIVLFGNKKIEKNDITAVKVISKLIINYID